MKGPNSPPWFPLLILCLTLVGCGKEETSASLGSGNLRWASLPVEIQVDNTLTPGAVSDLQHAFSYWEAKVGRPVFVMGPRWDHGVLPYTGDINSPEELLGNVLYAPATWDFDPEVAGKTVVHSANDSIENALVLINPHKSLCFGTCAGNTSDISRRTLYAHELGHLLGFAHSNDPQNLMYPSILTGTDLDSLQVDQTLLQQLTN